MTAAPLLVSEPAPHAAIRPLTRHPRKPALYSREPFFREAYDDFRSVLGEGTEATLLRHGLLMIKPDGFALGLTTAVLDFYARNGFTVVAAVPVVLTPATWRTVWLYQMTQASLDRLAAIDLVSVGDGLVLLLGATEPLAVPGAVRLSELKGPAKQEEQPERCLRRVIRQPNRIFSLVHTADEPVDLVRECGILFEPEARRLLARAMGAGRPTEESLGHVDRARKADARGRRRFDLHASTRRVEEAVEARLRRLPARSVEYALLDRARERLAHERPLRLRPFLAALSESGVEVDRWDLGVALTGLIGYDVPGGSKVVDNLGSGAWLSDRRAASQVPAHEGV